jgi:predicted Rossmann fold flavoprotein
MKALKGVRCKACATLLYNGQTIASELGEVQFTEEALSGICIFQLSRFIGRFAASQQKGKGNIKGFEISLSLISDISKEEIMRLLINRQKTNPILPADQLLVGILNKKIAYEILRDAVIGLSEKTVSQVGSAELEKIAELCTDWRFTVTGTLDMRNAQVTGGGAKLGEFNTNTLESKKINGLFACGEVLDVDAICGGYNLHWAWSSGITAGTSAGRIEG